MIRPAGDVFSPVIFALSEGVGVLGLVNGLNSNGVGDAWLPFIGGAMILMLMHVQAQHAPALSKAIS